MDSNDPYADLMAWLDNSSKQSPKENMKKALAVFFDPEEAKRANEQNKRLEKFLTELGVSMQRDEDDSCDEELYGCGCH